MKRKALSIHTISPFVLWLFTIGWCDLSFLQGLYALIIWPYYIGRKIAGL